MSEMPLKKSEVLWFSVFFGLICGVILNVRDALNSMKEGVEMWPQVCVFDFFRRRFGWLLAVRGKF